ncbi:unnamed protein product [Arctia plantaginis]|uniref:Gustatory receptor n=1 Tax=Arctia plantaginis TaxID=874455 RepID=A0A8S1ADD4_ARCPL|nr:unnamed protein product [Arctia plantaginis]
MDNEILSQEHQGDTNTLEVVDLRLQQEIPEGSFLKTDFKSWIEDKKRVDINIESSLDKNEEYTINVELIFYFTWKASEVLECSVLDYHTFEKIVDNMFPAFFEIGVPYNILTATLLQNFLSPSIWGTLREDYNRATHLIRRFDDVFSGLVLLSFAINLFWICLQIFNILDNGIKPKPKSLEMCPHYSNPPFHGYEHSIFTLSSLTFLVARFTTMCLSAASVNVASLLPASVLYKVPSCSYSIEVQRFLDQVHDDVVALTGMKYFHITRELVLSMAGTILTYELVLLQLSGEELDDS